MKRVLVLITALLIASLCSCATTQAPSPTDNTPAENKMETDPKESVTGETAVWQDPGNVVIMWEYTDGYEYEVLRSSSPDGEFLSIGTSDSGSFRDSDVSFPNTYFYKIQSCNKRSRKIYTSHSFEAVTDPDKLSLVSVIMYHNFVTEEDVDSGIEFDEYSITPEAFEEDLVWLKENGYTTITSDELLSILEEKSDIPEKAVILSIDDGSLGVYTNAWPLLKKHGMKADFNVIGAQIDATWDSLSNGGTRDGQSAPYCTWEELCEMSESGEINICSHTYGLHVYDKENRVGMSMKENEDAESFASAVKNDYDLSVKCIEGWTGKKPTTVAYPYSKRSDMSDKIIFESTGYKILMAGADARGTAGNYFVKGCDISSQLMLMSRPCRMDGTPIRVYLENIVAKDAKNGVNINNQTGESRK